jgi:hypothetical protein
MKLITQLYLVRGSGMDGLRLLSHTRAFMALKQARGQLHMSRASVSIRDVTWRSTQAATRLVGCSTQFHGLGPYDTNQVTLEHSLGY